MNSLGDDAEVLATRSTGKPSGSADLTPADQEDTNSLSPSSPKVRSEGKNILNSILI